MCTLEVSRKWTFCYRDTYNVLSSLLEESDYWLPYLAAWDSLEPKKTSIQIVKILKWVDARLPELVFCEYTR